MKLENEIRVTVAGKGEFILRKGKRLSCGKNDLSYIKWYKYYIENSADLNLEYDCVLFSFIRITPEILKESQKRIVKKCVSKEKTPNVDGNTGNIHPSQECVSYNKIKQLVLCNGAGPTISQFVETEDYYVYNAVHKACYYPLIGEDEPSKEKLLKENWRYKLLSKIWKKIPDELKNEK